MRGWLLFVLLLLLTGCEEKHISRIYDRAVVGKELKVLRLSTADPTLMQMGKKLLKSVHVALRNDAAYTLQIEASRYAHHCNNPQTCAYDATYDGFAKLTLMQNMHPLYMIQRDYHGALNIDILKDLFDRMRDDLELKLP
jgi:hypothetical protein